MDPAKYSCLRAPGREIGQSVIMIPPKVFDGSCEIAALFFDIWVSNTESEGGVVTISEATVPGENVSEEEDEGRAISARLIIVGVLGVIAPIMPPYSVAVPAGPSRPGILLMVGATSEMGGVADRGTGARSSNSTSDSTVEFAGGGYIISIEGKSCTWPRPTPRGSILSATGVVLALPFFANLSFSLWPIFAIMSVILSLGLKVPAFMEAPPYAMHFLK